MACASGNLVDDAQSEGNKQALRRSAEEAAARGIFGVRSFLAGEELLWGDDRLEEALDWTVQHG